MISKSKLNLLLNLFSDASNIIYFVISYLYLLSSLFFDGALYFEDDTGSKIDQGRGCQMTLLLCQPVIFYPHVLIGNILEMLHNFTFQNG